MRINQIPESQRRAEGAFIERRMDEVGVTQDELATELEVTQGTVSKWCRGIKPINPQRLFQLARRLEFDAVALRPSLKEYVDQSPNALEDELFAVIRSLPQELKESLLHQVKIYRDATQKKDNP